MLINRIKYIYYMNNRLYTSIGLLASLILLFCTHTYAQQFTLTLHEILTIGENVSDTTEYMFGNNIRHVQPIAGGNILIADGSDNTIRIFDRQGKYFRKFGRRGRGPGEFHEITSVEVDNDERIMIADRFQGRITFYSSDGRLIDTNSLNLDNQTNLQYIYNDPNDGNYYIGYRDFMSESDDGYFLHSYDRDLEKKDAQYINVFEHFFNNDIPIEYRLSTLPDYRSTKFGVNSIAVTPSIYTGKIAIFEQEEKSVQNIGNQIPDFYEIYDWENRNRYREEGLVGFASVSGFGERFFYKSQGYTFSLIGNSRFLLQFIGFFNGKIIKPHLRIFSSDGTLLTSISLEEQDIPFIRNNRLLSVIPAYLDEQNRLYIADRYYRDSYPAVRIFETNLDELLDP